ncbi:hypothetical protein AAVH_15302 [Aphelenchoides avenae]|nr:hypothetical protein AAVH_15302 [Aphelenchus avenae]
MGNKSGKEAVPEACTSEPEPGVTNAFEHDELFPLKYYEGHQLRINEVFQKAAEALEEFESRKDNWGSACRSSYRPTSASSTRR